MSSRRGSSHRPTIILYVIALILVGMAWTNHAEQTEMTFDAASLEYEESKRTFPLGFDVERHQVDPQAYRDEWRQEQGLLAQRHMATWTARIGILTAVGVLLLTATLFEAFRATIAAQSVVAVAQDAAHRELRAYVNHNEIVLERDVLMCATTEFKNGGATPAYELTVRARTGIWKAGEEDFSIPDTMARSIGDIGPGATFPVQAFFESSIMFSQLLDISLDNESSCFIFGEVHYVDLYGVPRHTKFRFEQATKQDGQMYEFRLTADGNEST